MKRLMLVCIVLVSVCMVAFAAKKTGTGTVATTPMTKSITGSVGGATPTTGAGSSLGTTRSAEIKAQLEALVAEVLQSKATRNVNSYQDAVARLKLAEAAYNGMAGNPIDPGHASEYTVHGGETCADAVSIDVPGTVTGTTCNRVDDYFFACPEYSGDEGAPDVVYKYTAPINMQITLDLAGSAFDTKLYVFDGECTGSPLACNDDFGSSLQSKIECLALTAGHTYYIVIDGWGPGTCGHYNLAATICGGVRPGETCATALPLTVPSTVTGSTCNFLNDYDHVCPYPNGTSKDVVYSYTPTQDGSFTFDLGQSGYDTKIYIYQDQCGGDVIACNDDHYSNYRSRLECVPLTAGHTYYVVVDGYGNACGNYTLIVSVCENPTPPQCVENSGFSQTPSGYNDVWNGYVSDHQIPNRVFDNFTAVGFSICDIRFWGLELRHSAGSTSWAPCDAEDPMTFTIMLAPDDGGQPGEATCTYTVSATRVATGRTYNGWPLWMWDATLTPCCPLTSGWVSVEGVGEGTPDCAFAWISSAQGDNMAWGDNETASGSYIQDNMAFCLTSTVAPTGKCCYGDVAPLCATNTEEECTRLQGVWDGTKVCDGPFCATPPPTGKCCYGAVAPLCATNTESECNDLQGIWTAGAVCDGPFCTTPPPTGRCCYVNDDNHPACANNTREECASLEGTWNDDLTCETPCVVTGRCCYVEPTGLATCAVNSEEACARLYGTWATGLTCEDPCESNCSFPYESVDMGDLPACNYPTLVNNPGHGLSGVAWLGTNVSGEEAPRNLVLDRSHWCEAPGSQDRGQDTGDDGVAYFGQPWMPCTNVSVLIQVTAGPNYQRYVNCGHHLYVSGWKDGNLDGDFCDVLCDGTAPEWIVQDQEVFPGTNSFSFKDPGVFNLGVYAGVFRWRLSSHPVGAMGFGLVNNIECGDMQCGTFDLDYIGEVEDYFLCDAQLPVELTSLTADPGSNKVTMKWTTASETRNDFFEVVRDGITVAHIGTQGNDAQGHTYQYVDNQVENGTVYNYNLVSVDLSGVRAVLRSISAAPKAGLGTVTEFALHQNFPNPFNPSTHIAFDVPTAGFVTLKLYNVMGQEVATLVNGTQAVGQHVINFEAGNLPSGLYLYRMTAGSFVEEKKMLIMK